MTRLNTVVAVAGSAAIVSMRAFIACWLIVSGHPVAILYGLSDMLAVVLTIGNAMRAQAWHGSGVGLLVLVVYALPFFVRLEGGEDDPAWATWAMLAVVLTQATTRLTLGWSYTAGVGSWVKLADRGAYGVVRHPALTLGVMAYWLLTAANPTPWNVGLSVIHMAAVMGVMLIEESFLTRFQEYREYAQRVRYRMVPGLW